MFVEKCRKRCIEQVNKIRQISRRMSNELRAENISCEFRDTDGFEATEGSSRLKPLTSLRTRRPQLGLPVLRSSEAYSAVNIADHYKPKFFSLLIQIHRA